MIRARRKQTNTVDRSRFSNQQVQLVHDIIVPSTDFEGIESHLGFGSSSGSSTALYARLMDSRVRWCESLKGYVVI